MSISFDNFKTYLMSGNPFAPESIRRFDLVTKIGVALSVLGLLMSLVGSPMMMMAGGSGALVALIIIALYLFVLYMIVQHGKAWAKWVYIIFYVIGLIGFVLSLRMMFMFGMISGLINLAQYGLGAYACFLLIQKDSNEFIKS